MKKYYLPFKKFESDGCSGGFSYYWKRIFKCPPPFEVCCYQHDIEYHYGSGLYATSWETFKERLWVDNQFFLCLWKHSLLGKIFAAPMWIAVRLGGGAYLRKSYSWGYGWKL